MIVQPYSQPFTPGEPPNEDDRIREDPDDPSSQLQHQYIVDLNVDSDAQVAGGPFVRIDAGNGSDRITIQGDIPAAFRIYGGPGNDDLEVEIGSGEYLIKSITVNSVEN